MDPTLRLRDGLAELAPRHGVRLAYLFGSAAAGRTRPESDIDIALLAPDEVIETLRVPLGRAAGVDPDRLDLCSLERLPVSVAYRAIRDGVLLYDADSMEHARYAGRIASLYFDFQHYERAYGRSLRTDVAEKGFAR